MKIALTGATGFVGTALLNALAENQHRVRCWYRGDAPPNTTSRREWVKGELGDQSTTRELLEGCDALVHTALYRPSGGWSGDEGDLATYLQVNLLGSIQLFELAFTMGVRRVVFVSTCAVHEKILDDRPLDETHPLWPNSPYGAHKAALEMFVSSYGLGKNFEICALRPTGIYGLKRSPSESKWFSLIEDIAHGKDVTCTRGGKEVHVDDVARAIVLLLDTEHPIQGQAFNCYDQYISQWQVAHIAKEILGSTSLIHGEETAPKHQIDTSKIRALGMEFGGERLLRQTIEEIAERVER